MLNGVVIDGTLETDVLERKAKNGKGFVTFLIRNDREVEGKYPEAMCIWVSVFGGWLCDQCRGHRKGDKVQLVGYLTQTKSNKDNDSDSYIFGIKALDIQFPTDEAPIKKEPIKEKTESDKAVNQALDSIDVVDDDLPF